MTKSKKQKLASEEVELFFVNMIELLDYDAKDVSFENKASCLGWIFGRTIFQAKENQEGSKDELYHIFAESCHLALNKYEEQKDS